MTTQTERKCGSEWLSPLRLSLLVVNAVCFGGCLVLLAVGHVSGSLVLLAVGVGLSVFAGTTGAIMASHRRTH